MKLYMRALMLLKQPHSRDRVIVTVSVIQLTKGPSGKIQRLYLNKMLYKAT
jgi:hypothetical protein